MQEWRSQRKINHWEADQAASVGEPPGDRYWLTPPEIYEALKAKYGPFDFDPCPCPRPEGYNSLVIPWGARNYVNPPFHQHDGVDDQGPTAFARKAIAEQKLGKTSVLTLPVQSYVNLLLEAGAELHSLGQRIARKRSSHADLGGRCGDPSVLPPLPPSCQGKRAPPSGHR